MTSKLLIFCAGNGTRIKSMVKHKLKPMIKVAGKPVLQHIIEHAKKFGITDICINVHHEPDQIMGYFGDQLNYYYEPELLGTAGAVKKIGKYLGKDFIVMNGDTLTDVDLEELYLCHIRNRSKGVLATMSVNPKNMHHTGTHVLSYKILSMFPKTGLLDDTINDHKKVASLLIAFPNEHYFDIGTPKGLRRARRFFRRG